MIVAAGVVLDFGAIKGLEEIGEAYTNGDASKILKVFGNSGIIVTGKQIGRAHV